MKQNKKKVHSLALQLCEHCGNVQADNPKIASKKCPCGHKFLTRVVFIYSEDGKQLIVE